MAESLWSNERIRDRYHALVPCEANMGEMEYWNVLRDVGERVSYELRDTYEAERQRLSADHAALVARIAELETLIAYIDKHSPLADETCVRPGITLSEAARFQMMEDNDHE